MKIGLSLTKAEGAALMKYDIGAGWKARPSLALQAALFKVREAIINAGRDSAPVPEEGEQ